jgi:hypothetical protein
MSAAGLESEAAGADCECTDLSQPTSRTTLSVRMEEQGRIGPSAGATLLPFVTAEDRSRQTGDLTSRHEVDWSRRRCLTRQMA